MQTITPTEQIDFETNKRLLNRYRFIEYETLRILAGWLPATARMEWKLAMGRLLWEDAQHVQQLYQRLREIQMPAFRPPGDAALEHLMARSDSCTERVRPACRALPCDQTSANRRLPLA